LVQDSRKKGAKNDQEVIEDVVKQIKEENVDWAIENPDDPRNFPRVFFNWRSNLLGDSGKGHEYFAKHLVCGEDQILGDKEKSWKPNTAKTKEGTPMGE